MGRAVKVIVAMVAAFICAAAALFEYSEYEDHKNFGAAKNDCEQIGRAHV